MGSFTTTEDSSAFLWCVLSPSPANVKVPGQGAGGTRTAPPGVPGAQMNWICSPLDVTQLWVLSVPELINLMAVGKKIVKTVQELVQAGQARPVDPVVD